MVDGREEDESCPFSSSGYKGVARCSRMPGAMTVQRLPKRTGIYSGLELNHKTLQD